TWMTPDAQPTTSAGTSSTKMILDGRYLQETSSGDMGGFPFSGQGLTAYDNASKKYEATWVDNMSTAIFHCDGSYDAGSKSLTMKGMTHDPAAGKEAAAKRNQPAFGAKGMVLVGWGPGPACQRCK